MLLATFSPFTTIICKVWFNPVLYIYSFLHIKVKRFWKTLWKKVKLLKMSNFTFLHNVFCAICVLKSFNSHISVVVCRFFEFGTTPNGELGNGLKDSVYFVVTFNMLSANALYLDESKLLWYGIEIHRDQSKCMVVDWFTVGLKWDVIVFLPVIW